MEDYADTDDQGDHETRDRRTRRRKFLAMGLRIE